jgi:hypothetical protein
MRLSNLKENATEEEAARSIRAMVDETKSVFIHINSNILTINKHKFDTYKFLIFKNWKIKKGIG